MTSLPFDRSRSAPRNALVLPEKLESGGLLVGWSMEHEHVRQPIGFTFGDADRLPANGFIDPILMNGEGHLITIAPTGAGKGVGCIIPALLRHTGPAIVIDPKGENAAMTARRRRELGQEVVVIDPAGITRLENGAFNPLDLIDPEDAGGVDRAASMAMGLLPNNADGDHNRFWISRGRHLLSGLILHVVTDLEPKRRTLATVREIMNELAQNPSSYRHTLERSRHPEVRSLAGMLSIGAESTLGSIIGVAQEGIDFLRGTQLQEATARTSFDLDAVTRGDPLTIYIVLPPHMLASHGRMLRVWIGGLLSLITRHRSRPAQPTLFLLDEAAQMGELDELRTALTLLRGYGLQTWSFWQDVSQLRLLYPRDWQTMVNNCQVIQTFGPNNMNAARDMANFVGFISAEQFLEMKRDEMLLQIAGDEVVIARLPHYKTDPIFQGLYDENPLFDTSIDPVPQPRLVRSYLRPQKRVEEPRHRGLRAQPRRREPIGVGPGAVHPVDALIAERLTALTRKKARRKGRREA